MSGSSLNALPSLIPILVGPTGVGKSEIAFHLALRLQAEIISADAFQVYQGMEIGTAQPAKEWQKKVRHHLVGVRKPDEGWNAVEFARQASYLLREKNDHQKFIVVGGAGFYIRALVTGPPQGSAPTPEIRLMISEKVKELGNAKAHTWLMERDPSAAKRLNSNDIQRVSRALEKTFSLDSSVSDFEPVGDENVLFIGLERSRENLDKLLRARTEEIWKNGILTETEKLIETGVFQSTSIESAIGYAEAAAFLRNEINEAQALEKIFRRTRQYAKRQWTWFKHQHNVQWINLDDFQKTDSVIDELEKKIKLK